MSAATEPLRVGDRVTVRTDPALDPVQLCLGPRVVIVEVLTGADSTRYRLGYPGERAHLGPPVLRERLIRGWR